MSVSKPASEIGGTKPHTDVESLDVSDVDDARRAAETARFLDARFRQFKQELELLLGPINQAASRTDADINPPSRPEEVPFPAIDGRDWVVQYEDEVPFELLAHFVVLVEYRRKARLCRVKQQELDHRFNVEIPRSSWD